MMVNRYITALLVVLAATGMEAQTYQQALKFALTDIHQVRRKIRKLLEGHHANHTEQHGEAHPLQIHEGRVTNDARIRTEQPKAHQIRH